MCVIVLYAWLQLFVYAFSVEIVHSSFWVQVQTYLDRFRRVQAGMAPTTTSLTIPPLVRGSPVCLLNWVWVPIDRTDAQLVALEFGGQLLFACVRACARRRSPEL